MQESNRSGTQIEGIGRTGTGSGEDVLQSQEEVRGDPQGNTGESGIDLESILSDKHELALAIVLWKHCKSEPTMIKAGFVPTESTEQVYNQAVRMAKLAGVKKEFFEVLFLLPVLSIKIQELGVKIVSKKKCSSGYPVWKQLEELEKKE